MALAVVAASAQLPAASDELDARVDSLLADTVAVVTGATRGIGRGVALGLGEAGATVYLTGRTVEPRRGVGGFMETVGATAAEVTRLGGKGIAVACDHRDDEAVRELFARVRNEQGRLDVLVNNVWGGYERFYDGSEFNAGPFWEQPLAIWDAMHRVGVRAHYVAAVLGVPIMVEQRRGLIVNISSYAAQVFVPPVAYGVAHAAIDRLAADMAEELRSHDVTSLSLYPGLVRTEAVLRAKEYFDLSNSESPQFIGRVVAALAADPDVLRLTGGAYFAAEVAAEYGVTDIDGSRPRSLRRPLSRS